MEDLFTPISTVYKTSRGDNQDALIEISKPSPKCLKIFPEAATPEEALEVLRNEPNYDVLVSTLKFILKGEQNFNIRSPSPLAAQLVHVLVSDVVPNYWNILLENTPQRSKKRRSVNSPELELLLSSLRSVPGLNAVLLSLKQHIQLSKEKKAIIGGPNVQEVLRILLHLLQKILEGSQTSNLIWKDITLSNNTPSKQKAIWTEFLNLLGSGKIIGIAAEAEDIINTLSSKVGEKHWIAEGTSYSLWLAQNIVAFACDAAVDSKDRWLRSGELLIKSSRLGYTELIVKEILTTLALQSDNSTTFLRLLDCLPGFEQRNFLYGILKIVSRDYLSISITTEDDPKWWKEDSVTVSAAAGLINLVLSNSEERMQFLISWLTSSSGAGVGDGVAIRRAVLAAIGKYKTIMETVLEKTLQQFGDQLYIKHVPTLQQEAHAQVLLLASGYLHRYHALRFGMMLRSGVHLSVISNRLGASSPRARFLGMIVGEALSSLVDKSDSKMDFKVDEMKTNEAKWYKSLVNVIDTVGPIDPLKPGAVITTNKPAPRIAKERRTPKSKFMPTGSKIVAIEEIEDEEDSNHSDNDGLIPYAKPDSDAEDSDEDPTLITRNKPTAPVYIRDLITYLRDTESYDRQKLGLTTAAPLIRRKASFGTEVSSHVEELATLLVGIQDKYKIEQFEDLRLQGMIAVLIALPLKMGQWFSKTFFDGDYSISQRISILTTLGLGARELGGFGSDDEALTSAKALPSPSSASFPSKALPPNLHNLYIGAPAKSKPGKPLSPTAVDTLSTHLTNTMIAPMATSLADKLTGPSILKVRKFSSRMAVEAKRKKPTTNNLAKVVSDGFFFPLTGRFFIHLRTYGSSKNVIFHPVLLSQFLKTLSLILHASGPSTLSLPQMTGEFWDLLFALRTQSVGDILVMEALLFGFMTILELNTDQRHLVESHGRQMLETQEWVEGVFGRLGSGGGKEDERVRMLAAGVLVRLRECVDKYQALLMGDLASYPG